MKTILETCNGHSLVASYFGFKLLSFLFEPLYYLSSLNIQTRVFIETLQINLLNHDFLVK